MTPQRHRRADPHAALREFVQRVEQRERAGLYSPAEIEEARRVVTWLAKLLEREERPHG